MEGSSLGRCDTISFSYVRLACRSDWALSINADRANNGPVNGIIWL